MKRKRGSGNLFFLLFFVFKFFFSFLWGNIDFFFFFLSRFLIKMGKDPELGRGCAAWSGISLGGEGKMGQSGAGGRIRPRPAGAAGVGVTQRKDGLVTRPENGGAARMKIWVCSGSKPTRQDRVLLLQRDLQPPSSPPRPALPASSNSVRRTT